MNYLDLEGAKYLMRCAGITPAITSNKDNYSYDGSTLSSTDLSLNTLKNVSSIMIFSSTVNAVYNRVSFLSYGDTETSTFLSSTGVQFALTLTKDELRIVVPAELKSLLSSGEDYTIKYGCVGF